MYGEDVVHTSEDVDYNGSINPCFYPSDKKVYVGIKVRYVMGECHEENQDG